MKYERRVSVQVKGRTISATITVEMPGVTQEDYLDPAMLLAAVASGQDMNIASRHNAREVVRIQVNPADMLTPAEKGVLRLVA